MITKSLQIAIVAIALVSVVVSLATTVDAYAKEKTKEGNTGQCYKLQRELDLGGSKQDCKDTFSYGNKHNQPPLP